MAGLPVDLRGIVQVLAQFDFRNTPYYAVLCGKDLKFEFKEDDLEQARNVLSQTLELIESNGTTAIYKVEWYDKVVNGKLLRENLLGTNTFRLNQIGDGVGGGSWDRDNRIVGYGNGKSKVEELLEKVLQNQLDQDKRLKELEADEKDEEPAHMKMISGMLGDPVVQRQFAQRLLGIMDMILPATNKPAQPASVSGAQITEIDIAQMNASLEILLNNGMVPTDVKMLADMCINHPDQFKFLLSQLRK